MIFYSPSNGKDPILEVVPSLNTPFQVKTNRKKFSDFSSISPIFDIFWQIIFYGVLSLGLLPSPLKPTIPHGSPIVVFYKK